MYLQVHRSPLLERAARNSTLPIRLGTDKPRSGWNDAPCGIISLFEIMRRFEAGKWLNAVTAMMQLERHGQSLDRRVPVPADLMQTFRVMTLDTVKRISKAHGLIETYEHCLRAEQRLDGLPSWELLYPSEQPQG